MTALFTGIAAALKGGWWRAFAGAALAIAPAFLIGRCSVDVGAACAGREAKASAAVLRVDRAADGAAAIERRADDATIANQSAAIQEVTRALPDQAPTARQRARACQLLRQQGAAADVLGPADC